MGEVTRYPHGTMCWIDLETTDVDAAKRFFGDLYGWELVDMPTDQGPYTLCRVGGKNVAAIHEQPADQRDGAPSHWNQYVAVDDLEATVERAGELGAALIAPPIDVPGSGRTAVLRDPGGAVVNLWLAGSHVGAQLVNEPGAWTWSDLGTRDLEAARSFYRDLLGWQSQEVVAGYFSVTMGDLLIGGIRDMADDPPDAPPHWLPYIVVERIEDALARAEELGGRVVLPVREVPAGKLAVYGDPVGAYSAMFEMGADGPARGVDGS